MTKQQLAEAYRLRQQGYSIRDIASELDIPKSTIDKELRNYIPPLGEVDESESGFPKREADKHSELFDAQNEHERKMAALALRKQELELQRRDLEIREQEAANQQELLDIKQRKIDQAASSEAQRIEGRKRQYVGKFNRLVEELANNCGEGDTWSKEEVEDYLDRSESLLEKITKFCDYYDIDSESLAIVVNLDSLIAYVGEAKEEKSGLFSSDVCFEADKQQKQKIKSWVVTNFEDEAPELDDEDEDDEDED